MATRQIKRYLTPLAIRKMQNKATMTYHCIPMRMANLKQQEYQGVERESHTWLANVTMTSPLWKTIWQFLIKLNMCVPYNSAIILLGTDSRENDNSSSHRQSLKATLLFFNR